MVEVASVVRVVISCAFICGLVWVLGQYLRRVYPLQSPTKRMRLIETLPLGSGKSLLLVAYKGRCFLLASTSQTIQLLAEFLDDQDFGKFKNNINDEDFQVNRSIITKLLKKGNGFLSRLMSVLPMIVMFILILTVWMNGYAQSPTPNTQHQLSVGREAIQILIMLTLIVLSPSLLAVMTCFTRIIIVFSLLRLALGTPQTPPNTVLIGTALFLTMFVMAPTLKEANDQALQPFLRGEINAEQVIVRGYKPFQKFMLKQVREQDIALFLRVAKLPNPKTPQEVGASILIPAFILSEVRTGFEIGFLLSIPFLIVDLVIASTLMGMGMLMVPPMLLSLPLKLLLFILADGWHLLMKGLALSVK